MTDARHVVLLGWVDWHSGIEELIDFLSVLSYTFIIPTPFLYQEKSVIHEHDPRQ
jgi:hypothetical protein